jgi:hypothetical protein
MLGLVLVVTSCGEGSSERPMFGDGTAPQTTGPESGSATSQPTTSVDVPEAGDREVCPWEVPGDGLYITCITPADRSTNVPLDPAISVELNRPVDPGTLGGSFEGGAGSQDFALSWSDDERILTLDLFGPLEADQTYVLELEFAFGRDGEMLANPASVCFSTGPVLACPSFECPPPDVTDGIVAVYAEIDYSPPFAPDSIWNTPIGDAPEVDRQSDLVVARFAEIFEQFGGMWLSATQSAVPIYVAGEETARQPVRLTADFAPGPAVEVRIPDGALPDCDSDHFLVVYDRTDGRFYELWRPRQTDDGSWVAATGNSIEWSGGGIYPGDGLRSSQAIRASGFSLAAGAIWPHELAAGRIEHALVFGYDYVRLGPPVAPATASDGAHDDPAALPMGAHLQLDPSLDLDRLGLEDWERTVAVALQEYGMYLGDSAGGIPLVLVNAYSFEGNPYEGLLPATLISEGGVLLSKLPAGAFRMLAPGAG